MSKASASFGERVAALEFLLARRPASPGPRNLFREAFRTRMNGVIYLLPIRGRVI
jgi:hypothetical protein